MSLLLNCFKLKQITMNKKHFTITTSKEVAEAVQSLDRSYLGFGGRSIQFVEIQNCASYFKIVLIADENFEQEQLFHDLFFIGMGANREIERLKEH